MTNLERWLETRMQGIGGSDAGTVLGDNPYDSPYALWTKKTGLDDSVQPDNAAMEWGRRLESAVLGKLRDEHPNAVVYAGHAAPHPMHADRYDRCPATCIYRDQERMVCRSDRWSFMQATPDGFMVDDSREDDGLILVEVKTSRDMWDPLPPYVFAQVQHNLAVFGLQLAVVPQLALSRRHYEEWWVKRDDEFIARMADAEATFWKHVQDNDAPPTDTSDATVRAMALRDPIGESMKLPAEALGWDERLQTVAKLRKQYDEEDRELRARFITAIGDAESGQLPNGVTWTFRKEQRKGYSVSPKMLRILRRRNGR